MSKRDLIGLRDAANGDEKKTLRWAVGKIEELERTLTEVRVLAKAIQRATEGES